MSAMRYPIRIAPAPRKPLMSRASSPSLSGPLVLGGMIVLAALSRLPLGFFVKRVWLFVPIFTGAVVLPATFSLTTTGLIVLRVATSISLVVLLLIVAFADLENVGRENVEGFVKEQ